MVHTFAVYEDLGVVTIGTHEHCLIVNLFIGQAGFAIDNLE